MTVSKVYAVLAILNIFRMPLMMLPFAISTGREALNAFDRIQKFLISQEIEPLSDDLSESDIKEGVVVRMHDADFAWGDAVGGGEGGGVKEKGPEEEEVEMVEKPVHAPILRNISLRIQKGDFIAVIGRVGCGE